MGKILATLVIGLLGGLLVAWWWLGGTPRTLAQPSERLAAWIEVASTDKLPIESGGTTWIVGCTLHLRNIGPSPVTVSVPVQRFLLVLGDGSTVTGTMGTAASARVAEQQTASIVLPKVSFFARSQDASSMVLAIDEGDGLRLVAAPVGGAPAPTAQGPEPAKQP